MSVEAFGADREDIKSSKFQKYKMKTGTTDRIGFIFEDPKKIFRGALCHVVPEKRIFMCKSTKEKKEICCTHAWSGNIPRWHIGCVIIIYNLIQVDGKFKLKDYLLMPWLFWEKTYGKLQSADKEFPLDSHDVKLTCSNEEFQTIDIQSCRESIWVSNTELKKKVIAEALPIFESINKNLASDLSITEIKENLGIETAGVGDAATDVNLGDVISTIE